jgi:hypothetical protein
VDSRIEALRRVPIFAQLGDDGLQCVADAVNEVEVPAGQLLVQPGAPGSGMFFIAEGTAVVETKRDEVELGPGQFFGELALMSEDATRTARVQAKTDLRCLASIAPASERWSPSIPRSQRRCSRSPSAAWPRTPASATASGQGTMGRCSARRSRTSSRS